VLKKSDRVELLEVNYPDLVADPSAIITKIAGFLGESFRNGPQVAACVNRKLYRQRTLDSTV